MPALCETFRWLSFRTWDVLSQSRRIGHQPLEETFTDLNIFELNLRHPFEIFSKIFTKPQEGVNGADWEWWLTDSRRTEWLGLRMQAKVLELSTNEFKHLHYRRGGIYQANKLKRSCRSMGLIPLYCLYTSFAPDRAFGMHCPSFPHADESFGCSITSLKTVEMLRANGHRRNLSDLRDHCLPWHCLVCCKGYGGNNLPQRAWGLVQGAFGVKRSTNLGINIPNIGPRANPPTYLNQVLENALDEPPDPAIRAITIVVEPKA
jgi:hypothetical protein